MSLRRGIRSESTTNILDDNDSNLMTIRQKKMKKFLCVCWIGNGVLIIILLVLFIVQTKLYETEIKAAKKKEMMSYEAANTNYGVCVPCNSLGPGVKAEDTLFDNIHTDHGKRICCFKEEPYLQLMIARMIDPMITKPIPDIDDKINRKMQWWRSRKNAMHMYLDVNHLTDKNLTWTVNNDQLGTAFMNNMNYDKKNNSMGIVQSGIYFVYSAITFNFGDVDAVGLYYHSLNHWYPVLVNTTPPALMSSRFGGSSESRRIYTSFLCGAFKFSQGLSLQPRIPTAAVRHVQKSKYASYFGIFQV